MEDIAVTLQTIINFNQTVYQYQFWEEINICQFCYLTLAWVVHRTFVIPVELSTLDSWQSDSSVSEIDWGCVTEWAVMPVYLKSEWGSSTEVTLSQADNLAEEPMCSKRWCQNIHYLVQYNLEFEPSTCITR